MAIETPDVSGVIRRRPGQNKKLVDVTCGLVGVLVLALSGCAGTDTASSASTMFYPPPPNPPRIQYLATFSEPNDVKGRNAFTDFLFGDRSRSATIKKPYGVAEFAGKIYVADERGAGYAVFDLVAQKFSFVNGEGTGSLRKPINIAVDPAGNKYITDLGRHQVVAFDKDDNYLRAYEPKGEFKPAGVAVIGDRLYVSDTKQMQIDVFDVRSGKHLLTFGRRGEKDGEMLHPTNLAAAPNGNLYVTDTNNFRVQEFTPDGKFVRVLGGVGTGLGRFARPKGLAVDREGRIYVADAAFENVQAFNQDGKLLLFFGSPGAKPYNLNLPAALAINYDDAALFQRFADPMFKVEYVILVASQFGPNKVNVYGFGRMEGADYPPEDVFADESSPGIAAGTNEPAATAGGRP